MGGGSPCKLAGLPFISVEKQKNWFNDHDVDNYPVFVFEKENKVVGWLSLSAYRKGRQALASLAEITYYLHTEYQGKGYAKALIKFVSDYYKNNYKTMLVGTGETPTILSFYNSCGFEKSHSIRNFFTDNYDHPMFEDGIQLIDMVYLKKKL